MDERPRRRTLTPLSGELKAEGPLIVKPPKRRRRQRRPPPTTTGGAVLHGLLRFALSLVVVGGVTAGVAALVVTFGEAESERTFKLGFYLIGACLAAIGAVLGSGTTRQYYYADRSEREVEVAWSVVYVAVGASLIGIGFALDVLL